MKIIECVPNLSEGRNLQALNAIREQVETRSRAKLLGFESNNDYNRAVVTLAGNADEILSGAIELTKAAAELIDMSYHSGEHPRIGAIDVVPFVPVRDASMEECIAIAKEYGKIVSENLSVPVYLYEEASEQDYRKSLSDIRKGEYEGLESKLQLPEWVPDFGTTAFNKKLGAIVTGARFFLIAYNVNIKSTDVSFAKEIAEVLRESGRTKRDEKGSLIKINGMPVKEKGKLKFVKGMGVQLENYGITQVSMNLTNYIITPIHVAFEAVKAEAARLGITIDGSEIVGLTPLDALVAAGKYYAKGITYSERDLLKIAIEKLGLSTLNPLDVRNKIIDFLI